MATTAHLPVAAGTREPQDFAPEPKSPVSSVASEEINLFEANEDIRQQLVKQMNELIGKRKEKNNELDRLEANALRYNTRLDQLEKVKDGRDADKIEETRAKIEKGKRGMQKAREEIDALEKECCEFAATMQIRIPGVVESQPRELTREIVSLGVYGSEKTDSEELKAKDEQYVQLLQQEMKAIKMDGVPSLKECIMLIAPFLQQEMSNDDAQYSDETKAMGDKREGVFNQLLGDFIDYVNKAFPDHNAIRMYTAQRFPVYATVSHIMVDTRTRITAKQLRPAVKDCLRFQTLLDTQLEPLPCLEAGRKVYRGINHKFKNLEKSFPLGSTKIFYEPKSSSLERETATYFATTQGTVVVLTVKTARQINQFSFFPEEGEAVIRMFTNFSVTHCYRGGAGKPDEIRMTEI